MRESASVFGEGMYSRPCASSIAFSSFSVSVSAGFSEDADFTVVTTDTIIAATMKAPSKTIPVIPIHVSRSDPGLIAKSARSITTRHTNPATISSTGITPAFAVRFFVSAIFCR